jgi:copper(I)-binding protein
VKTANFARFALVFAALGLAACGSRQEPSAEQSATLSGTITASDGRLVLPAVHGNPGAVYFTVHNGTASPATLESVEVEGAKMAMLHETRMVGGHSEMQAMPDPAVPAGGDLVLQPGGRHVMAMDVDDSLKPGGTTTVTLSFAGGAKTTLPAEILAAGNAR